MQSSGEGAVGSRLGTGPVGGTQTQQSATCLKAVSLGFGKEGTGGGGGGRPTKGAARRGRQGSAWDRARQVQAARCGERERGACSHCPWSQE